MVSSSYETKNNNHNIYSFCDTDLQEQGFQSPQVFLVSSFELHLHDFPLLTETLERELPEHKRNVLLLAMCNISQEIINKKKKAFQANIIWYATLSAAGAGVPVPGLSTSVDAALLAVVKQYTAGFGLDKQSLENLAGRTGVQVDDLKAVINSQLAATKVTTDVILRVLTECACKVGLITVEEAARLIPLLGTSTAMGLSFTTTYRSLNIILNELADDAQRVFEKALGCNTTE